MARMLFEDGEFIVFRNKVTIRRLFFVISGYLITSILLEELNNNNKINILHFYGRRARRILPALILVILLSTALGIF